MIRRPNWACTPLREGSLVLSFWKPRFPAALDNIF